jgi:glyoxylase-like metal-dependent hydrolase (beta-lactamase superfamily II)
MRPDGDPSVSQRFNLFGRKRFSFFTNEIHFASSLDIAVRIARDNLLPLQKQIRFISDKEEFIPGIRAIFTPGHTLEHSCFEISSELKKCILLATLFIIRL